MTLNDNIVAIFRWMALKFSGRAKEGRLLIYSNEMLKLLFKRIAYILQF